MSVYFDPEFDSNLERVPPPGVCIDNDSCQDSTLVKVDSANRHGILLEMVQVLTDLDLIISKSYISSDGPWLMDVFHVNDHLGNKVREESLINYIKQSLDPRRNCSGGVTTCLGNMVGARHMASNYTVLEVTAMDQPGLLSEIAAVISNSCNVNLLSCQAWTHNSHAAVIICLVDEITGQPISEPDQIALIEEQVKVVIGAHLGENVEERRRVKVLGPSADGRVHIERRLHQLMHEDRDYEAGPPPQPVELGDQLGTRAALNEARKGISSSTMSSSPAAVMQTRVSIDSWRERGYSVVSIISRDRPKLLFDTVCTLTDMQYIVSHAAVSAHGIQAMQEYYIRHMDGRTILATEVERRRVTRCLVAAVERRVSHGLRVDLSTRNRRGLLAEVTRVLRESGLSLTRADCAVHGEKAVAVGTFYVSNASGGGYADAKRVEDALIDEMGGSIQVEVSNTHPGWPPVKTFNQGTVQPLVDSHYRRSISSSNSSIIEEEQPSRFSFGSLLWSHIGRFSSNFGSIRS